MRTTKHGIMRTRGSGHALAAGMLHGLDEFDCELFIQHYKDLLPAKDDAKASVR
jgi:hypothetical protein